MFANFDFQQVQHSTLFVLYGIHIFNLFSNFLTSQAKYCIIELYHTAFNVYSLNLRSLRFFFMLYSRIDSFRRTKLNLPSPHVFSLYGNTGGGGVNGCRYLYKNDCSFHPLFIIIQKKYILRYSFFAGMSPLRAAIILRGIAARVTILVYS